MLTHRTPPKYRDRISWTRPHPDRYTALQTVNSLQYARYGNNPSSPCQGTGTPGHESGRKDSTGRGYGRQYRQAMAPQTVYHKPSDGPRGSAHARPAELNSEKEGATSSRDR